MEIVLIGLNHRTAPVALRERVAFTPEQARRAAEELRSRAMLEETLVLSTCNRSELYGVPAVNVAGVAADDSQSGLGEIEKFFAAFHRLAPADLNGSLYRHANRDAVRHLYRVTAGLDSMLLGEAEILGQVREAYRVALDSGATGPVLNRMFQGALEVGKRVRAETEIGTRPVSIAFAGVKLAQQIFGELKKHRALILGAGAVGEQVVAHLRDRGIAHVLVANRSRERGEELAKSVQGEYFGWEDLPRALEECDMVVSSVGGADRVVTRAMVKRAMKARAGRAMFLIDLGMPRNIEPGVGKLYNVYLYNLDDLGGIVEQNKKARESEIPRAEAIIDEHVGKFEAWQARSGTETLVKELRAKLEEERDDFLRARLAEMPGLSAEEHERLSQLAEDMLDRLVLRRVVALGAERRRQRLRDLQTLRVLFGLDKENS